MKKYSWQRKPDEKMDMQVLGPRRKRQKNVQR